MAKLITFPKGLKETNWLQFEMNGRTNGRMGQTVVPVVVLRRWNKCYKSN